ncbi:hypothetical protein BLS_009709 [Venturia inaequalis]|uniref:Uncharacterized protein n=1 Tax=Venturia inaequalis TaxID=5025 RepID=A0A8H3YJV5_VENIN|nr:hypothetical protein BLS_009709 [Venturia inaequalis]KAE9975745.1 hypothetical protein EG328_002997 [Venturia inaequalis]KAE9991241.1 hypothetical protein EG327_000243 [Venturia inaequalis]
MKATLSLILALAASAIAAPVMRRDESTTEVDSTVDAANNIAKLESSPSEASVYVEGVKADHFPGDFEKRDETTPEADLTTEVDSTTDYEDEIEALVKRDESTPEADLITEIDSIDYEDEIEALVKRGESTTEVDPTAETGSAINLVNHIPEFESSPTGTAADDEELNVIPNSAETIRRREESTTEAEPTTEVDSAETDLTVDADEEEVDAASNPADTVV